VFVSLKLSGTSDPYCQVEVLGAKKKTSTKYETLGCVFDEILFFNFKNIGRDDLKQASIKVGSCSHQGSHVSLRCHRLIPWLWTPTLDLCLRQGNDSQGQAHRCLPT
jgi:hypothetical protein